MRADRGAVLAAREIVMLSDEQDAVPEPAQQPGAAPSLRLVARFVARARRRAIDAALASGRVRRVAAVELLAPERLGGLARDSLVLLLTSGAGFVALELAARHAQHAGTLLGSAHSGWRLAGLVAGNLLLYGAILPVHEAVHAAVILGLGGRPTFGVKLPLAAYCTAPGQLFTRDGYVVVALAPLVALTLAGAGVVWLAPTVGAYLLLALAGNVAGAVGDLVAARDMGSLPRDVLIADTATGYEAYLLAADA
jgi:hypothetical protein